MQRPDSQDIEALYPRCPQVSSIGTQCIRRKGHGGKHEAVSKRAGLSFIKWYGHATMPPPVTQEESVVHPLFRCKGVFTRALTSFTSDRRAAAHANGFTGIAAQLDETEWAAKNIRDLKENRPGLKREGFFLAGWSTFGQGRSDGTQPDPKLQGMYHAELALSLNLEMWLANGETWIEGEHSWKSAEWLKGWTSHHGSRPLTPLVLSCLSSSTSNFARNLDWNAWLAYPGPLAISPQVYTDTDADYTLGAMYGSMEKTPVPRGQIVPTYSTNGQPPLYPYPAPPGPWYWLWTGEDAAVSDFGHLP